MGLALSSSHHYSSQLRVRAQSDRHSSGNTVQLTLVNNKKPPKTKPNQSQRNINDKSQSNYYIRNSPQSWHFLPSDSWNVTLHLKALLFFHPCLEHKLPLWSVHSVSPEHTHTYRVVLLFADKHNGKTTGSCYFPFLFSSKPFNIKAVFTSVWWHHAEC